MRRAPAIAAAIATTASGGILLLVLPNRAALVAHVWLVVVLALALATSLERLNRAVPRRRSPFDAAFVRAPPPRARPATLARAEREVTLAIGTAFDVHYRLRPMVRSIASGLLLGRGLDVARSPERARVLVGESAWDLVRSDAEPPTDRSAPGIPVAALERAVDDLERLACS